MPTLREIIGEEKFKELTEWTKKIVKIAKDKSQGGKQK